MDIAPEVIQNIEGYSESAVGERLGPTRGTTGHGSVGRDRKRRLEINTVDGNIFRMRGIGVRLRFSNDLSRLKRINLMRCYIAVLNIVSSKFARFSNTITGYQMFI